MRVIFNCQNGIKGRKNRAFKMWNLDDITSIFLGILGFNISHNAANYFIL